MTVIDPLHVDASKSGTNRFTLHCQALGQSMHYAACLNRLETLDTHPDDWYRCQSAVGFQDCAASAMRRAELEKGQPMFFMSRDSIAGAVETARKWVTDWRRPKKRAERDMLDAMGDLGDYADAVSAKPSRPVKPLPVAQTGETPLQMARRLASERKSGVTE